MQEQDWRERDFSGKEYEMPRRIAGGLILVGIGVAIGANLFPDDPGYWTNPFTEVLSVAVTVFVLDAIRRYWDREKLKKDLIRQTKRRANDTVLDAIDGLRENGWLTGEKGVLQGVEWGYAQMQGANLREADLHSVRLADANLQGAILEEVNLESADLYSANLQDANLRDANLERADLWKANLQGANLYSANLQGANLYSANLQDANLSRANLQGASLVSANLQGASLVSAILRDAKLRRAKFDETMTLPDAGGSWHDDDYVFYGPWTPFTDMSRFTDPNHPDFWQPEWVKDDES